MYVVVTMSPPHFVAEPRPQAGAFRHRCTFPLVLQGVQCDRRTDTSSVINVSARFQTESGASRAMDVCVGDLLNADSDIRTYLNVGVSNSNRKFALVSNDFFSVCA